jgi:hypothetical protein
MNASAAQPVSERNGCHEGHAGEHPCDVKNMMLSLNHVAWGARTSVRFTPATSTENGLQAVLRFAILISIWALTACKSSSPSQYVSPRVSGRVLDAQSNQPINGVQVRRLGPDQNVDVADPPKAGQVMEQSSAVRTGRDGTFVLDSVRNLALFRKVGWYTVSLSFAHAGYEGFVTNYTLANATNTAKGEPLVTTGDIHLRPLSK